MAAQGISARGKNRLKREAKKRARSGGGVPPPPVPEAGRGKRPRTGGGAADVSEARPGGGRTGEVNDGQGGYEEQFGGRYCDFQPTCEVLKTALLDMRWEARHGAAIGLRQIISSHAESVGRRSVDAAVADHENRRWLEDMCCRLVCVLAMDRFGDFVGDAVVAPVRETAAMAMAAASRLIARLDLVDDSDVARVGEEDAGLLVEAVVRDAGHGDARVVVAGELGRQSDVAEGGEEDFVFEGSLVEVAEAVEKNVGGVGESLTSSSDAKSVGSRRKEVYRAFLSYVLFKIICLMAVFNCNGMTTLSYS